MRVHAEDWGAFDRGICLVTWQYVDSNSACRWYLLAIQKSSGIDTCSVFGCQSLYVPHTIGLEFTTLLLHHSQHVAHNHGFCKLWETSRQDQTAYNYQPNDMCCTKYQTWSEGNPCNDVVFCCKQTHTYQNTKNKRIWSCLPIVMTTLRNQDIS